MDAAILAILPEIKFISRPPDSLWYKIKGGDISDYGTEFALLVPPEALSHSMNEPDDEPISSSEPWIVAHSVRSINDNGLVAACLGILHYPIPGAPHSKPEEPLRYLDEYSGIRRVNHFCQDHLVFIDTEAKKFLCSHPLLKNYAEEIISRLEHVVRTRTALPSNLPDRKQ